MFTMWYLFRCDLFLIQMLINHSHLTLQQTNMSNHHSEEEEDIDPPRGEKSKNPDEQSDIEMEAYDGDDEDSNHCEHCVESVRWQCFRGGKYQAKNVNKKRKREEDPGQQSQTKRARSSNEEEVESESKEEEVITHESDLDSHDHSTEP